MTLLSACSPVATTSRLATLPLAAALSRPAPRRWYADAAAAAAPEATATAPTPSTSKTPALPPSSCPAGTPMPGLAMYKDRPELLAKPDDEYPPWLWNLLSHKAFQTTALPASADASSSGAAGAGEGGVLTKGQLRQKQKRDAKDARAARAAAERASKGKTGVVQKTEKVEGQTEAAVRDPTELEREKKKALRRENRLKIKSANFVAGS